MTHLAPHEIADFLEGSLDRARAAHGEACAECRRQVSELDALMREAQSLVVPEPSPLFWDHFSERVGQAIAAEPIPARRPWWLDWSLDRAGLTLSAAGALIALVLTILLWKNPGAPAIDRAATELPPSQSATTERVVEPFAELETEPEWTLVVTAADELDWDAATDAGFSVRPGSAERAVLQLSPQEQRELERLLKAELAHAKS